MTPPKLSKAQWEALKLASTRNGVSIHPGNNEDIPNRVMVGLTFVDTDPKLYDELTVFGLMKAVGLGCECCEGFIAYSFTDKGRALLEEVKE